MKVYFRLPVLCFVCGLLLISCDKQDETNPITIGLEAHQEDYLQGEKQLNGYQVNYQVIGKSSSYYTAKVSLDNHILQATIDYNTESIEVDGKKIVLDVKEKETLLLLGEEISAYLFTDGSVEDFTMAEYTLLRLLEYWAKSPIGYSYDKIVIKGKETNLIKGNDEGITCVRKNTVVTAVYDDASGRVFRDRKLVNEDRCLGRCGSGCPGTFSLASAWTKDCLDHDQCGRVLGGSTNPFDRNCGDEYGQAADDFLFGVLRGCRG